MTDTDELDSIWREGLSSVAAKMAPLTDPTVRVAERLRRRRRARMTLTALSIAVASVVIVAAVSLARNPHRANFATSHPLERVAVVVGDLRIHFPGRVVSGEPPHVALPHGVIRFDLRSTGTSHRLVIDGVPKFVAVVDTAHDAISVTVRIAPGRYLMHCTILGHTEAGEKAILIVK